MSAEATGWVYRHSPFKGATFAVHLAVADSVNDQHRNEFWMTQRRLGLKARVGQDTAGRALAQLHEGGYLEPVDAEDAEARRRTGRAVLWRFLFPEVEVVYETRPKPTSARGAEGTRATRGGDPRDARTGSAEGADHNPIDPKGDPKGGKPREPFPEFDAIVAVFGAPGTREEAAFIAKVARRLRDEGKAAPDIEARARVARRRWEKCTPNVLLQRWSQLEPPGERGRGGTWDDVTRREQQEGAA